MSGNFEKRPWGGFIVLSDEGVNKVKKIIVDPGKRMSLQSHNRRREHWHIVEGSGLTTLDDRLIDVKPGASVDIPLGSRHRIENTGASELIFIEVQSGDYTGEDDIVRYEDDFGRA